MVDELRTIREAPTEAGLGRAYATWMAEHTTAYAWELRGARDAFRERRRRLRLLQVELPEAVEAPAAVTAWLSDWAQPKVSSQALAERLTELGDDLGDDLGNDTGNDIGQDLERGRGRGSYQALLAARDQWLLLRRKPGPSEELLTLLQRRITTPDPAAREIEWAAGPDARALARTIRDDYARLFECERAFFRPHLAPPALRSDLVEARERKRLTGPGFRYVWAIVLGIVALNTIGRTFRGCGGEETARNRIDTSVTDRILERARKLQNEARLDPRSDPRSDLKRERMATLRFATRTDTTEAQILAHLERFGRSEAELRMDVRGGGSQAWHGDEVLRLFYKAILERLDTLRQTRGRR